MKVLLIVVAYCLVVVNIFFEVKEIDNERVIVVMLSVPDARIIGTGNSNIIIMTSGMWDMGQMVRTAVLYHEIGHRVNRHLDLPVSDRGVRQEMEADRHAVDNGHKEGLCILLQDDEVRLSFGNRVSDLNTRVAAICE